MEDRGGHVVAVAGYDPEATDFAEPIRKLVGYTLLDGEEKEALEERAEMRDKAPLKFAYASADRSSAISPVTRINDGWWC